MTRIVHHLNNQYVLQYDDERVSWLRLYVVHDNNHNIQIKVYDPETRKTKALGKYLYGFKNCEHINGDKLDFRRKNLRERTNYDTGKIGKSGERGIIETKNGRYIVVVRGQYLGYFSDIEKAILEREKNLKKSKKSIDIS